MHIDVKKSETGYLIPMSLQELPFTPKRVFVVKNKFQNADRGGHAHVEEEHYLVCVAGSVEIKYENYSGTGMFTLQTGASHHQRELEWLNLRFKENDTMLLVFSDQEYSESRYVRDYENFKGLLGART